MSVAHLYLDFGEAQSAELAEEILGSDAVEEQRLESFEAGYQAGWDDAVKAQEDDQRRVASDFAQNLQDMSFTYHEAIAKLTLAIQPLFELMVTKVLPDVAHASLGAKLREQLLAIAKDQMGEAVEIAVAPQDLEALKTMVADSEVSCPFSLVGEASLSPGQIYLRGRTQERQVDLGAVTDGIAQAVTAFFHQFHQEQAND